MNLDKLTEQEREQYYQDVCKAVGLPPELRLLEFIYVDGGDAQRKLVLYALKGATEHLRKINGISVTNLVKDVGDGYVAWIATGADKTGRTEMSTGAASTRGVTGEGLAKAVALAQTRAVRRMTLQFIGAGILDESEINEKTTNISSVTVLPVPIMPAVAPSSAPGKDVTPESVVPTQPVTSVQAPSSFAPVSPNAEVRKSPGPGPKRQSPVLTEELKAVIGQHLSTAVHACYGKEDDRTGTRAFQEAALRTQARESVESRAHEAMAELESLPQQVVPKMGTVAEHPKQVAVPLTKEEMNQKIFHYRTEVLEPAGLAPSSGMGIFAKIKAAMKAVTNTDDEKDLAKWSEFFSWIDQGIETSSAQGVVAAINRKIGATE